MTTRKCPTVSQQPHLLIDDLVQALTQADDASDGCPSGDLANPSTLVEERGVAAAEGAAVGGSGGVRSLNLSRSSSANDMVIQDVNEPSTIEA